MSAQMTPAKLKQERTRLGMTQARFADYLGVPLNTLRAWEQGQRRLKGLASEAVKMKLSTKAVDK